MLQTSNRPTQWKVIKQQPVFEHPSITVAMEAIRSPDGEIIVDWPKVYSGDFVNAVVLNKQNEALILEGYQHGLEASSWQMLGSYLKNKDEPFTAVKQALLQLVGYKSDNWVYLGSFITDANRHGGVGHFFCAHDAVQVAAPSPESLRLVQMRWVSLTDLRYALLDGRITGASYALNVALSLRML
jgi:hypothetical protein